MKTSATTNSTNYAYRLSSAANNHQFGSDLSTSILGSNGVNDEDNKIKALVNIHWYMA